MTEEKIIEFNNLAKPVAIEKRDYRACRHIYGVLVSYTIPKVVCRHCEAVLDPYWVLRQMAEKYISLDYRLADMAALEKKEEVRRQRDQERRLRRIKKEQARAEQA